MAFMNFGEINRIILFGGSVLMAEFVRALKEKPYEIIVFSSKRQLEESVQPNGVILEDILKCEEVKYFSAFDINKEPNIRNFINEFALGIGIGECWSFSINLINLFGGKLLDFMGICLPQYRGGAHYTWQILRRNRIGCCNLQIINEEMIPAKFDSGKIVKTKEYLHPNFVRIPQDYFNNVVKEGVKFLLEFLDEVEQGKDFSLSSLQEGFSILFPRLFTKKHGYIDWRWRTVDIEAFICSFDDPYSGASTFLNNQKIFLKKCYVEYVDGPFHPFQSGLIYRKYYDCCYVASSEGTLLIKEVLDENGNNIINKINLGERFYTPIRYIEEAMLYKAEYDASGIKDKRKKD